MNPKLLLITDFELLARRQAERLAQNGMKVIVLNVTHTKNAMSDTHLDDYHLLIINLFEANSDSLGICQHLRTRYANPILLLTHKRDEHFQRQAYAAGADACIVQPIHADILVARVQAWLRRARTRNSAPAVMEAYGFRFEPTSSEVKTPQETRVHLSPLEARLLHILMANSGHTVPNEHIVRQVWPNKALDDWDEGRLQVLVHRLRRKLESDPTHPQFVHTIPHQGYSFRPQ